MMTFVVLASTFEARAEDPAWVWDSIVLPGFNAIEGDFSDEKFRKRLEGKEIEVYIPNSQATPMYINVVDSIVVEADTSYKFNNTGEFSKVGFVPVQARLSWTSVTEASGTERLGLKRKDDSISDRVHRALNGTYFGEKSKFPEILGRDGKFYEPPPSSPTDQALFIAHCGPTVVLDIDDTLFDRNVYLGAKQAQPQDKCVQRIVRRLQTRFGLTVMTLSGQPRDAVSSTTDLLRTFFGTETGQRTLPYFASPKGILWTSSRQREFKDEFLTNKIIPCAENKDNIVFMAGDRIDIEGAVAMRKEIPFWHIQKTGSSLLSGTKLAQKQKKYGQSLEGRGSWCEIEKNLMESLDEWIGTKENATKLFESSGLMNKDQKRSVPSFCGAAADWNNLGWDHVNSLYAQAKTKEDLQKLKASPLIQSLISSAEQPFEIDWLLEKDEPCFHHKMIKNQKAFCRQKLSGPQMASLLTATLSQPSRRPNFEVNTDDRENFRALVDSIQKTYAQCRSNSSDIQPVSPEPHGLQP